MPYISKDRQALFDDKIKGLWFELQKNDSTDGDLEYCIFRLIQLVSEEKRCFNTMNALVGVLETTKLEFVRRIMGPYEDLKLIGNWKE